ncbi:hypothetical protein FI667_g14636, partial [Globisporangium splendens]
MQAKKPTKSLQDLVGNRTLPEGTLDFLSSTLQLDPKYRPSAAACLNHPLLRPLRDADLKERKNRQMEEKRKQMRNSSNTAGDGDDGIEEGIPGEKQSSRPTSGADAKADAKTQSLAPMSSKAGPCPFDFKHLDESIASPMKGKDRRVVGVSIGSRALLSKNADNNTGDGDSGDIQEIIEMDEPRIPQRHSPSNKHIELNNATLSRSKQQFRRRVSTDGKGVDPLEQHEWHEDDFEDYHSRMDVILSQLTQSQLQAHSVDALHAELQNVETLFRSTIQVLQRISSVRDTAAKFHIDCDDSATLEHLARIHALREDVATRLDLLTTEIRTRRKDAVRAQAQMKIEPSGAVVIDCVSLPSSPSHKPETQKEVSSPTAKEASPIPRRSEIEISDSDSGSATESDEDIDDLIPLSMLVDRQPEPTKIPRAPKLEENELLNASTTSETADAPNKAPDASSNAGSSNSTQEDRRRHHHTSQHTNQRPTQAPRSSKEGVSASMQKRLAAKREVNALRNAKRRKNKKARKHGLPVHLTNFPRL